MLRGPLRKIVKAIAKQCPGFRLRISLLRMIGLEIGENVYIAEGFIVAEDLHKPERISIGDRAAIGPGVILVTLSHPNYSVLRDSYGEKHGSIIIEEDAWIGAGAIILPGTCIGKKAIVGAGAVVTNNVSSEKIVIGIPAREIKPH